MTAFIIISLVLFLLSMFSSIIYVLNPEAEFRGGAVIGLIMFTVMSAWSIFLLFN